MVDRAVSARHGAGTPQTMIGKLFRLFALKRMFDAFRGGRARRR
jgi:hypothetical protein